MKKLLILLLFCTTVLQAQLRLSPNAEIRIITCGPGPELYTAFGHSAIRVLDTVNDYDLLYNYGVFNFGQPNFYLNFAKGNLLYRLAVSDYEDFVESYIDENRFVHEQILNLSPQHEQRIFDFLQWNALPENQHYRYDYFYDNCATRVRDVVNEQLHEVVHFDGSYIDTRYTIRDLCDIYLEEQPWGDFGIDLALGLPMDKPATPWMYMFLPDYIEQGFEHATITMDGRKESLVKETIITYESLPVKETMNFNTPFIFFLAFLILGIFITYLGREKEKAIFWFDAILFGILGLLGWFLFLLWVATDHSASAGNMNLLWAIPLHFPIALFLLRRNSPQFLRVYFKITGFICVLILLFWIWLPQHLHYSLIPLLLLIILRSFFIQKWLKRG